MEDSLADDDTPQLSAATLAALQEFYTEQAEMNAKIQEAKEDSSALNSIKLQEDWQLSQFWYTDETADILAREALLIAGDQGRIACISSPTAYKKIRELKPETCIAKCLEFDERFNIYGDDFVFYDYKDPVKFPPEWKQSFDIVIADPPFLSEECLCKTAMTIKYFTKDKIILCTGAIMEELASRLLGTSVTKFIPQHSNQLQNEFRCFTNYKSELLDS